MNVFAFSANPTTTKLAIALRTAALTTALMAAAGSASAQAAKQFDLICTGTSSTGSSPWQGRYSIDLEAGKYCGKDCKAPEAIARIEPDRLVLRDRGPVTSNPRDRNDMWRISVGRADGAYESKFIMASAGVLDVIKGSCTVGEFTPLPKTMF
jgi:hypothetical protein